MKLKRATFAHIEAELCEYEATKKFLREKVDEIIHGTQGEGIAAAAGSGNKNGYKESETEIKGTLLAENKLLQEMKTMIQAIEDTYNSVDDRLKNVMEKTYFKGFPPKYYMAGEFHVSESTLQRWRRAIVYTVAKKRGWR